MVGFEILTFPAGLTLALLRPSTERGEERFPLGGQATFESVHIGRRCHGDEIKRLPRHEVSRAEVGFESSGGDDRFRLCGNGAVRMGRC